MSIRAIGHYSGQKIDVLVGRKIIGIYRDSDDPEWAGLILDGGGDILFASRDEEQSGPGALILLDENWNDTIITQQEE